MNSAGIYDHGACCVKNCVINETGFLSHMVVQHLHDMCAVGRADTRELEMFYTAYRQFCSDLGISLAPTDTRTKPLAQPPGENC